MNDRASEGCQVQKHITLPEEYIARLAVLATPVASKPWETLLVLGICIARLETLVAPIFMKLVRFLAHLVQEAALGSASTLLHRLGINIRRWQ